MAQDERITIFGTSAGYLSALQNSGVRPKDQFDLSLDPERAFSYFHAGRHTDGEYCTMCGPNFCAMRLSRDLKKTQKQK